MKNKTCPSCGCPELLEIKNEEYLEGYIITYECQNCGSLSEKVI